MGREKVAGNPAELARKKAEEDAAAAAAKAAEGPKRKLHKIKSNVHVAKVDKVTSGLARMRRVTPPRCL